MRRSSYRFHTLCRIAHGINDSIQATSQKAFCDVTHLSDIAYLDSAQPPAHGPVSKAGASDMGVFLRVTSPPHRIQVLMNHAIRQPIRCRVGHHSSKVSGMAKKKSDTRSQATRILEARKAGTDESGRKFREAMGKATLQKQSRKPRG